jgi:hypothetical protein
VCAINASGVYELSLSTDQTWDGAMHPTSSCKKRRAQHPHGQADTVHVASTYAVVPHTQLE